MTDLRERITEVIWDTVRNGDEDHWTTREFRLEAADAILAIPEIAEALLLMRTARMRFCEAMRPATAEEMMLSGTPSTTKEIPMPEDDVVERARTVAAAIVLAGAPGCGNGNKAVAAEIKGGLHDDYYIVRAISAALQSSQPREEHSCTDFAEAHCVECGAEFQPRSPVEDAWQPAIEQLGLTLQGADGCETMLDAVKAIVARSPADPRVEELVEAAAPFIERLAMLESNCRKLDCGVPDETNVRTSWLRRLDTALAAFVIKD